MKPRNFQASAPLLIVLVMVTVVPLDAGNLNPPAGPVAPTMKTLTEVEPRIAINATNTPGDADSLFKITQPGSYYLTGNITGVAAKHGIEIVVSRVTLDLNGFELVGVAGSLDGVTVTGGSGDIAVRNGSVRGWGGDGIDSSIFDGTSVSDVRTSLNSGRGISIRAVGVVTSCTARSNVGDGIFVNVGDCVITGCAAVFNGGNGISAGSTSTLENCTANFNTVDGISAGSSSTLENCTANDNTVDGIEASGDCVITACSAISNDVNGISAGFSTTLENCTANLNTGHGISAGGYCTVSTCTTNGNTGSGIDGGSRSGISNCTANDNTVDGIVVGDDCMIASNLCGRNGLGAGNGAGIHATGTDNRIEGNSCTSADRGIDVDTAGNIIIKNTCAGNTTDWDIVANNVFGTILDRRAPASAAVSGFSAASSLGTTDPWGNISY